MTLTPEKTINKRNYGIDLLRIVSMFMVTLLHLSGHGGFLGTPEDGTSFYVLSFLNVICFGAVDIFAIISGFVMYNSNIKYSRIISLWFQVVFYSFPLLIIDKKVFHNPNNILSAFSPVIFAGLWYFTAYFVMFFFIPLYNKIINSFTNKFVMKFIFAGLIAFCILPIREIIGLREGYSFLWLSFCYFLGAFIKKNEALFKKVQNYFYFIAIAICTAITYLCRTLSIGEIHLKLSNQTLESFLLKYTSLTILIPAICMVILFSKINITGGKKVIRFFSSTSFSVYIIQSQSLIWNNYLTKFSTFFNAPTAAEKIGLVLGFSVAFYLAASLVDFLRIQLFKLLRINLLSEKICELLSKPIGKIKNKISEVM